MSKYFDVDSILAEDERIPVEMIVPGIGLGHLDAAAGTDDLVPGQRLEMPLWMAARLRRKNFAYLDLPRHYSTKAREALLAAPETARLRDRSPYYYETGLRLARLSLADEARNLPSAVKATLAVRIGMILRKGQNSHKQDVSAFVNSLTDKEQHLFWREYRDHRDYEAFLKQQADSIRGVGQSAADAMTDSGFAPAERRELASKLTGKRARP